MNHCAHCIMFAHYKHNDLRDAGRHEAASYWYELANWYTYNSMTTDDI